MATYDRSYIAEAQRINGYANLVPSVILIYDYLLLLRVEVGCYWKTEFGWVKVAFYLSRYVPLLGTMPIVMGGILSVPDCLGIMIFHQIMAIYVQSTSAVLLISRTYALYLRNKAILVFLLGLAFTCLGIDIWLITGETKSTVTVPNACIVVTSQHDNFRLMFAWVVSACFDTTIFILTVARSYSLRKKDDAMARSTLVSIMLRDGSFYYTIIILVTVLNIVSFVVMDPVYKGIFTTLVNNTSVVLISRLMLNLRQPFMYPRPYSATDGVTEDTTMPVDFTTGIVFDTFSETRIETKPTA